MLYTSWVKTIIKKIYLTEQLKIVWGLQDCLIACIFFGWNNLFVLSFTLLTTAVIVSCGISCYIRSTSFFIWDLVFKSYLNTHQFELN